MNTATGHRTGDRASDRAAKMLRAVNPPTRTRPPESDPVNARHRRAAVELDAISAALRSAMVAQMVARAELRTKAVIAAFATVAREVFAPGVPLGEMYDRDRGVITTRGADGLVTGSLSAPCVHALMLEQAGIRPGMRVLEHGSGGYNAALLAELVGPDGEVTTLDPDPAGTDRVAGCLTAAGYPQVRVLRGDAEGGAPEHAPFDRIIVTPAAGDLPPAWTGQLVEGGVLAMPLRVRGLIRLLALVREDGRLRGRDQLECCRFVPLGADANSERRIPLYGDDVALRLDQNQEQDADSDLDADALREAMTWPRVARRSGVRVGASEPVDDLDLLLAAKLDRVGLLDATATAIEAGLVEGTPQTGATTALTPTSFAYRAPQPASPKRDLFELVVYAHGPNAKTLAATYVALIREWDRTHRRGRGARIEVFPAGTPDTEITEVTDPVGESRVIDTKHTRILLSWPPTP